MFDRFSDNAKRLMSLARLEVIRLQHDALGAEHVLLGLLQLDCTATNLLARLGADAGSLREAMLTVLTQGTTVHAASAQLPFTPQAKQVLEGAVAQMAAQGDKYLGSQHVLLALAGVAESMPAQVLAKLGVTLPVLREHLVAPPPVDSRAKLRLLLISNSTMHGGGYLAHCAHEIRGLLGARRRVLFVPYALHDHDAYTATAREAFAALGHDLVSVHTLNHSPRAVDDAGAVFVGGGNTFRLLAALYHYALLPAIQQRAMAGMPYIGSSAGTNVATASIRTTNDMPIVHPPSFTALQLVPFQINPHYLDADPTTTHMGETREERLRQFHEEHATPVLAMREGCMLRVEGERAELRGTTRARLFRRGQPPEELTPPCDVSFLLRD